MAARLSKNFAKRRVLGAMHEKSDFSVQPLRPLCLCGCCIGRFLNHRDTEDAEVAQRRSAIGTLRARQVLALLLLLFLSVPLQAQQSAPPYAESLTLDQAITLALR